MTKAGIFNPNTSEQKSKLLLVLGLVGKPTHEAAEIGSGCTVLLRSHRVDHVPVGRSAIRRLASLDVVLLGEQLDLGSLSIDRYVVTEI